MPNNLKVFKENTQYAVTLEKEFEKSVKLLPDEHIEFKKRGVIFTGKLILQSPGFVVLTNRRMIFLMHHFFSPDKLLYIPLSAILKMSFITLGFFRNAQRAINLEYGNESIIFSITHLQKVMTGFGGPTKTMDFFELLKKKLSPSIVDDTVISISYWDYYLRLVGLIIGYIIGGILPILFCTLIGFLIGKGINKLIKQGATNTIN